jgi:hypothetical protein
MNIVEQIDQHWLQYVYCVLTPDMLGTRVVRPTEGPIELDTKLARSVESICSNLISLRTFDEIVACMVQAGE